jgi:hypothetical protein
MSRKPFRFTLLSKNASANHLESHSCKNKGLKVPCFHTLTKNIGGRGDDPRGTLSSRASPRFWWATRDRNVRGVANHNPRITIHFALSPSTSTLTKNPFVSPLDSALTSRRAANSFTSNTYEKHTQGVGGDAPFASRPERTERVEGSLSIGKGGLVAQAFSLCRCSPFGRHNHCSPITSHQSPITSAFCESRLLSGRITPQGVIAGAIPLCHNRLLCQSNPLRAS